MNYDTIFFDIGNTLFFYNYEFLRDMLAERFQVKLTLDEIRNGHNAMRLSVVTDGLNGKLSHDELWWEAYRRWFLGLGIPEEDVRQVSEAVRNHPFRHLFWSKMEEGTREMLDWFRERGFKLGVISNAEGQIKRLIEHANLGDRFDAIIDSDVVGFVKPDERIFMHAVERVGSRPERSVHVGDLFEVDVTGARRAGLTPILVDPYGLNEEADCIKIQRAVDLPKLSMFTRDDAGLK